MIDNNLLIEGDNIKALQWLLDNGYRGKIDFVYIDQPFATGAVFSVDNNGRVSTISKSRNLTIAYNDTLKGKDFIDFLRERIILIYQLLSDKINLMSQLRLQKNC